MLKTEKKKRIDGSMDDRKSTAKDIDERWMH